ncbi:MAG: HupE/UreJ family protein [Sphingomicrobium sp.]
MRCGSPRKRDGNDKTGKLAHPQYPIQYRAAITRAVACVALILLASPAHAHSGTGLPGGFAAGVAHPLTGADHMLAMISVGLWGHFLGRPLIYVLPMVFPVMMAVGAGIGMIGIALPPVELGIALSVVILGALVLGAVRAKIWFACAVVGLFALFHGYAHGIELPSAADPIGYSLGFVFATGSLHVLGITIGALARIPRGEIMLRGLGGIVLAFGLYFLWAAWP